MVSRNNANVYFSSHSDVLSMVIALYAIKLASRGVDVNDKDQPYTFGFQRAEILAALVNGVFLLALCFSIIVEALSRFYSPSGTRCFPRSLRIMFRDLINPNRGEQPEDGGGRWLYWIVLQLGWDLLVPWYVRCELV